MKFFILLLSLVSTHTHASNEKVDKSVNFFSGYSYNCKTSVGRGSIDSIANSVGATNIPHSETSTGCEKVYNVKPNMVSVSPQAFSNFLRPIRDEICSAIKPGSVKIGVGVDAEGKIFGVGLGSNSTIEVNIECK